MNVPRLHPGIIGIGIDKGDGDSTSPVFNNSALLSSKPPLCFLDFIPTHKLFADSLFPAALEKPAVHNYHFISYYP